MSHSTQNRSFQRHAPSQSLGLLLDMEKLNLTQQKHTFINQKKCTTTQLYFGFVDLEKALDRAPSEMMRWE